MFRKKAVISLVLLGIFTFGMLTYFYFAHRSFMQNQREFLINLSNLDNYNSDIESELLKNSLFVYNSQDKIAQNYDAMQKELKQLQNSKILNNKLYAKIKKDIDKVLKPQVDKYLIKVQDFLLLNASVKNSFVYLSSHVDNALYVQKVQPKLYIEAIKILNDFKDTKKMQDLDYLNKMHYLLEIDSKDEKIKLFIKIFNLHSSYIMKKLPPFVQTTQYVVSNKIGEIIHKEKKDFDKVALVDFRFYDMFAFIVAVTLSLYLLLAIYLFLRYQKANRSLNYSLSHDHLTGLHDRSSFVKDTAGLKNKAVIMLLNVDGFKKINDVYGNHFGDRALVKLTECLREYFKTDGVKIYRVGGDEFAFLFKDKGVDEVMQIAKDLEESIQKTNFDIDKIRINLSSSIAVNGTEPLLENADLALKVIKKDMNKRVIKYEERLSVKKEWKKNIEVINMVKSALKEDRVVPYFQPIVNLKTMKIEKYESLVRVILPSGEVLAPYYFLDILSRTHYYYDITKTMIRKTIKVAKSYPEQRFSINFSMKDITNQEIIDTLFELFEKDIKTASRVDIELLETELVAVDDSRINDFIKKVHTYGSKILIDDFGTGYSNFSYLSDLDVDIIKIDASITKEILSNPRKLHILQTIHNFTSGMDMLNVAEYVETKEIALLLQKMGVEYAQGYLFSKPVPTPLEKSDVTL